MSRAAISGNGRRACEPEFNYRMREKALIGDNGSQVGRKRSRRPCRLTSKGLSLCLFELNYTGCEAERQKLRIFCFVVFRSHSLSDFLESRVMKRKSINH